MEKEWKKGVNTSTGKTFDLGYKAFLTGANAIDTYVSNFRGIPVYTNNEYLIYSSQYELHKLTLKGVESLFKYIDLPTSTYYFQLIETGKNELPTMQNKIFFYKATFDCETFKWDQESTGSENGAVASEKLTSENVSSSDYILPFSSSRLITQEDVAHLSAEEIDYA